MKPIGPAEWRLAAIMCGALLLWMFDFLHHVSPGWIALGAAFLCLLPRLGVLAPGDFAAKNQFHAFVHNRGDSRNRGSHRLQRCWGVSRTSHARRGGSDPGRTGENTDFPGDDVCGRWFGLNGGGHSCRDDPFGSGRFRSHRHVTGMSY